MPDVVVISLAYDPDSPFMLTHLCEGDSALCGADASGLRRFDNEVRGRRQVADLLDCAACSRVLASRR